MTIERIEITHHQLPLEPPFPAAWDSQPRRLFPATMVRVHDSSGAVGIGSGDAMYGFRDYAQLFIGRDPLDIERHSAVLHNIGFHAGRCWPLEVALWDLAGKLQDRPVWRLLGGHTDRLRTYASSGVHRTPARMAALAEQLVEQGIPALKIRFGRPELRDDLAVLDAVRQAVGGHLELMIDCNQGWRMPWDTAAPWTVDKAMAVARELEQLDVYWMEEPLHRGDYSGLRRLRDSTMVPIAGGEMTREPYEFDTLLANDCLDVYQPDAVCTCGIRTLSRLAREVARRGLIFTPHTWGNGIGLLANLHLTAGTVGAPFIELPHDPPEWTAARRDFMLTAPIEPDSEGWLVLSEAPGLGIELDEARLAATLSDCSTYG